MTHCGEFITLTAPILRTKSARYTRHQRHIGGGGDGMNQRVYHYYDGTQDNRPKLLVQQDPDASILVPPVYIALLRNRNTDRALAGVEAHIIDIGPTQCLFRPHFTQVGWSVGRTKQVFDQNNTRSSDMCRLRCQGGYYTYSDPLWQSGRPLRVCYAVPSHSGPGTRYVPVKALRETTLALQSGEWLLQPPLREAHGEPWCVLVQDLEPFGKYPALVGPQPAASACVGGPAATAMISGGLSARTIQPAKAKPLSNKASLTGTGRHRRSEAR